MECGADLSSLSSAKGNEGSVSSTSPCAFIVWTGTPLPLTFCYVSSLWAAAGCASDRLCCVLHCSPALWASQWRSGLTEKFPVFCAFFTRCWLQSGTEDAHKVTGWLRGAGSAQWQSYCRGVSEFLSAVCTWDVHIMLLSFCELHGKRLTKALLTA